MTLRSRLEKKLRNGRKLLSIYLTAGYPDITATGPLLESIASAGADLIELGVPFSDPLADGPTIQAASQQALAQGASVERALAQIQIFTASHDIPVLLMGYVNPFMQFGWRRLAETAAGAGACGFIIPDLPPEESVAVAAELRAHGLDLIHLVSPNTTLARIDFIDRLSRAFIYAVSVTGVTGVRAELPAATSEFLRQVSSRTSHPVLAGFGVSGPEAAVRLAACCDGVIIGSAVLQLIAAAPNPGEARELVRAFVAGVRSALDAAKNERGKFVEFV